MADQPGFFEGLIGSNVDETAVLDNQIAEDIKSGGRLAQMTFGLGQQAAGGLGVALAGAFGKGQEAKDGLVAQANGISVNELRARRRIRQETADITDDGTFSARRKMAEVAARIANEEGDARGLSRALSATQRLNEEEAEFDKLKSSKAKAAADATKSAISDGFTSDGNAVSGIRDIVDGQAGLNTTVDGEIVFKPFDEGFSQVDPNRASSTANEPISKRIARISSTAERAKIRGLAASADQAVRKTDRILSTLTDLFKEGGVESVIGTSGGIITAVDNLSRNVQGVISAFSNTREGAAKDADNRAGWKEAVQDGGSSFSKLIQLPEGVQATSAAAQQHRAAVMEMAYMAARLAEPSNRGLSDNDIKNALTRIAGSTSNPQVMMRRFLEMQTDAAHDLDFNLRLFHGALGDGVSDSEIDQALTGKGLGEYRQRKDELFQKFGVTEGSDGRVTFGPDSTILGTDVQPGEGAGGAAPDAGILDTSELESMTDEEAAEALGI